MSNTGVFLRCPVSVAERIRAAIVRENADRAAAKLDPFALYKGEPCLPPYFARAGEREIGRLEQDPLPSVTRIGSDAREATLNVNFDVSPALAARAVAAIRAANKALRAAKGEPICLRSGQPSLPQFFLRAGLLGLDRDEAQRTTASPSVSTGRRADAIRAMLRKAPATMDDLVAAGLSRYEARNTISGLMTGGDVTVDRHTETSRRGRPKKPLYALTESGRAKAAQVEGT